jgi:hypothetical protein
MIVEHEVIEQLEEEPIGRPIAWVCDLARRLGRSDPMTMLWRMWQAGYLAMADDAGHLLQTWQCDEIWRVRREAFDVRVVATPFGSEWVHGAHDQPN